MQRHSIQTAVRLLWLIATAASLSRQPVRSVNLNNFINHQTSEEEFASQRRADIEAAAARLRAEADAAAKLKLPKARAGPAQITHLAQILLRPTTLATPCACR